MISFIIAFFSIIVLAALHELGHFLIAKKCGVKVEEFGIGYPPRIFGKKIGETLYSINILPLGAFVKMEGEEESIDKSSSFSNQSIKNKVLITSGGVLSFWLIAIMIFSFILYLGYGTIVDDNDYSNLSDFKVRILEVVELSPAEEADLKMGDTIRRMSFGEESISPLKIKDIQFFVSTHLGEKIDILIERGDDEIERSLIIRDSFPEEEGAMGVALIRTAVEKYPWYAAIFQGIVRTWDGTIMVLNGYGSMISNFFRGVSSDGGVVKLESSHPNEKVILINSDQSGWVVISDVWYPGWKAWVDGQPVPILKANYLFRAIEVDQGKHQIVMQYLPLEFYLGCLLSFVSWFFVLYFYRLNR